MEADRYRDVVVVGGGASGVLAAAGLLGGSLQVALVERTGRFGRGVAYGTAEPAHLLNVRVRNLSACSSAPDDLTRWCAAGGIPADPDAFLPRHVYAAYLAEHLDRAEAAGPGELARVAGDVVAVTPRARGFAIRLASGRTLTAGVVVLALGNLPPARPRFVDDHVAASDGWVADPWQPGALDRVVGARRPVLVGTGLTAVDVALVVGRGSTASIDAISRHGLLPRSHRAARSACPPVPTAFAGRAPTSAARVVRALRAAVAEAEAGGGSWQEVVDGLRPVTNAVWSTLDDADRDRIARRWSTHWSVHRHRTAPAVGARVADLEATGRLRVHAATVVGVEPDRAELVVRARARATGSVAEWRTDCLVNCTGPDTDWVGRGGPLLAQLAEAGLARPDRLGLGLDTTCDGGLVGAAGQPVPGLYTLGPPRRGGLWESTAIPEIRAQAEALACTLAARGPAAADAVDATSDALAV